MNKFRNIIDGFVKLSEAEEQLDLPMPRRGEVTETLLELNEGEYPIEKMITILMDAQQKNDKTYKNIRVSSTTYEYGEYSGIVVLGTRAENDEEYNTRLAYEENHRQANIRAETKRRERAEARKAKKAQGKLDLNTSK